MAYSLLPFQGMSKTNFRGEPIHSPEFLAMVDNLRSMLRGRAVWILDDIPSFPRLPGDEGDGTVIDVVPTPDYDSFQIVMEDGSWWGAQFPRPGEEVKIGPGLLGFKVDVLAGRWNRWVEAR